MGTVSHAPPTISMISATKARVGRGERFAWALVALACLSVLIVAAGLKPSTSGAGTHKQLGLNECGWVLAFGKPCFTCGMTTAFAHAADGRLDRSFVTQPFGALLSVGVAAGFWVGAFVALTGSTVGRRCASLLSPRLLWWYGGALTAAWAYKLATWPT